MNKNIFLIIYLAALTAFAPFSTDIYLASMPIIQQNFHTSASIVQLTLSLFFISFALTQLFWGPLSDRIGRKSVVLIGLVIFIIASFLCALSHTIVLLIIARVIQGIGACAGIVMALAMVRDFFLDSGYMPIVIGRMMAVAMIAPMIAPIIGSNMLVYFGWQSNFYILAAYGIVLLFASCFIRESYPVEARKSLPVNKIMAAYFEQFSHRPFLLITLAISASFGTMFAFISSSSFIYIRVYHLQAHLFGYLFAISAFAIILGNMSIKYFKKYLGDQRTVILGVLFAVVPAVAMFIAIHLWPHSLWAVVIPCCFITYSYGMLFPILMTVALSRVLNYTGLASSLISTSRFMFAGIISFIMGTVISHSALPLAVVFILLSLVAATLLCCDTLFFKVKSEAE
ncbi:MAG: multidrug effflux MFS transporter [Pseudomonadota bacterium]